MDTVVNPGDPFGTLQDQRTFKDDGSLNVDNTHVHLVLRDGQRIFNPAHFFEDKRELSSFNWSYTSGESLYSISSYVYTPGKNYWEDFGNTFGVTR